MLAHAFLPYKKTGGIFVGYSSGVAILPPSTPFLSKGSSYSISKMATARFYEFLALENPDLNVFTVHPGVIRTSLLEKSGMDLEDIIDTSKLESLSEA